MKEKTSNPLQRGALMIGTLVLLLAGPIPVLFAQDQIILDNGDRITGDIKRIWGGELMIEPAYASELAIDLSAIERIISERRFEFEMDEEDKIVGRLEVDEAGTTYLVTDDQRQAIALTDIEELEEITVGWDRTLRTDLALNGSEGNSDDNQFSWQAHGRLE